MSLQSEQEMDNIQEMLRQGLGSEKETADEKQKNVQDHIDEIKNRFAETVKSPLDAIGGSLTEDKVKDILTEGLKKTGGVFSDEEVQGMKDAISKGDVKGISQKIIDKIKNVQLDKPNLEIPEEMEQPLDKSSGTFQKIKNFFSKANNESSPKTASPWGDYKLSNPLLTDEENEGSNATERVLSTARNIMSKGDGQILGSKGSFNMGDAFNNGRITVPKPSGTTAVNDAVNDVQNKLTNGADDNIQQDFKSKLANQLKQSAVTDVEDQGEKKGSEIAGKAFKRMAEIDSEGEFDPVGDVVGLIAGIGTLFAGLFSKKKVTAPTPTAPTSNVSFQVGA
tara:strand:- start:7637 stop:8647 length:1011 start_codon:yes stop_codon:yes gene_type:complete